MYIIGDAVSLTCLIIILAGESDSECLFCNAKVGIADLSCHMKVCRTKVSPRNPSNQLLSSATDLDLLVQSLSRKFQVRVLHFVCMGVLIEMCIRTMYMKVKRLY